MSINFPKNIIFLVFTVFLFFAGNCCFAWNGFEHSGSQIEIGSGNLVREGETIKFYDWDKEEERKAEVRSIDYFFNTTRLEVYDFIEQKVRIFEMEN